MKIQTLLQRKWNYTAVAFAIPTTLMLVLMLVRMCTPFGGYSFLYSDMYHQYYPFFTAFRRALLEGDSLLYSWNVGMGMDYLGLIAYYLASPLNLLGVLVPEGLTLQYFSLLMPVKLGLASMFFALFLKKIFGKDDISISLFGAFYAMCAWALAYQWNVMWLDSFALLPLVLLGMVSMLRDGKFMLYTLTLFLSVFSNYYIGFFTCIFVFFSFFCYEICCWGGFKKFFADLVRIALFSILAIGMTGVLTLPALSALQSTQSSVNAFPEGFRLNIADENTWEGLLQAMKEVAGNGNGGIRPSFKEGLPNLYCGVLTNICAFLFLTCRQVKVREKICTVLLLLFFNLSFILRQLDYIWHGFHFTNMIPYRFSFLYSFVMLYMAYRAFLLRHRLRLWQVIVAGVLAVGLVLCHEDLTDIVMWAYNGVFLLLYLSALVYCVYRRLPKDRHGESAQAYLADRVAKRASMDKFLCGFMAVELVLNLVSFAVNFPSTDVRNYPQGTDDTWAMVEAIHEDVQPTDFFRSEVTHSQTLNDGALMGYDGISTFTSSANVKVTEFMRALGFGAKNTYNRYCYEEGSPVADLFLNLKYLIERSGELKANSYYDVVDSSNDVYLLENNAYLPLGFLAESDLADADIFRAGDPFSAQQMLFESATGLRGALWSSMTGHAVTEDELSLTSGYNQGKLSGTYTADTSATLVLTYTAQADGYVCTYLDLPKRNGISVYLNEVLLYTESISLPQMFSIGNVKTGDVIEVRLSCKAGENGSFSARTVMLNDALFRQGHEILSRSTLELTTFQNTLVEGTIRCDRGGILYTSIPQNGNWQVFVDGEACDPVLIGDVMLGVPLTRGEHTVRFEYKNDAFVLGLIVTAEHTLILAGIYINFALPRAKKGKFQKRGGLFHA